MKNCEKIPELHIYIYLGQNTSKYCSQLIVDHVNEKVFSKVLPACHNIANGIKPGRLINMLPITQKLYVGA